MNRSCILILFLISSMQATAQTDTLRIFEPKEFSQGNVGSPVSGTAYGVRLGLKGPALLHAVRFYRRPLDTGACLVRIYDGNGGAPSPIFGTELIEPIHLRFTQGAFEMVNVPIEPPVPVFDEYFFVVIDRQGLTGIRPAVLGRSIDLSCVNEPSEYFHGTVLQDAFVSGWSSGNLTLPLVIEAVVEYTAPIPSRSFIDITRTVNLPLDIPLRCIAWRDLDNDGWQDVLIAGRLFRNRSGSFEEIPLNSPGSSSAVSFFIDADGDGDDDILVLDSGMDPRQHILYRNDGDWQFSQHSPGLPPLYSPSTFAIIDANGDSLLDFFVGQAPRKDWHGDSTFLGSFLFLGTANTQFIDASALLEGINCEHFHSLAAIWTDFDNDGLSDLHVTLPLGGSRLWRRIKRGTNNRLMEFIPALDSLAPLMVGTVMGIDWGDFDNDGSFDPLLPRRGNEISSIARNHYADTRTITELESSGVHRETAQSGCAWGDINNDGRLDAIVGVDQKCHFGDLYIQLPNGRFALRTFESGLAYHSIGPDMVWVDIDNDGWLDLATGEDGKFRLFRNMGTTTGNWVQLDLIPTTSAVLPGTQVTIIAEGHRLTREVHSGRGLLMQDPARVHIGLGSAMSIESVIIRWASGAPTQERFVLGSVNTIHKLRQGTGTPFE